MTSKIRFLGDGAAGVHILPHFWQLSSPLHPLFAPLKPCRGATDLSFRPSIDPPRKIEDRPATTVQLLIKKRSFFLTIGLADRSTIAHQLLAKSKLLLL